jgi:hypothetical protein
MGDWFFFRRDSPIVARHEYVFSVSHTAVAILTRLTNVGTSITCATGPPRRGKKP